MGMVDLVCFSAMACYIWAFGHLFKDDMLALETC
jgi:hypothetical protein